MLSLQRGMEGALKSLPEGLIWLLVSVVTVWILRWIGVDPILSFGFSIAAGCVASAAYTLYQQKHPFHVDWGKVGHYAQFSFERLAGKYLGAVVAFYIMWAVFAMIIALPFWGWLVSGVVLGLLLFVVAFASLVAADRARLIVKETNLK